MTFSRVYIRWWKTIMFLVIFPQLCRGLLSDFKICGDSECETLISRVQAVRDHHGKDCRYLSFRQGESIFVYHKLTGKRSNLWAGSINKQFGYFPKEAVKEEQKFSMKEIVVPTQESDFLCVDDLGYPTDSNHLDTDDDVNDDDSDLSPHNDIEMSQTNNYETNSEIPSKSQDIPVGSDTSKEELEDPETAVELQENGGSPPSSWLSSPLVGWLGLQKPEEPDTEVKKEHLQQEEESFTSSVTGGLGLRSEGKSDDTNPGEPDTEFESLASRMTGWLGFGGEEEADSYAENVDGGVKEMDMDTAHRDKFRSRKMDLDLEAEKIQEEIKDRDLTAWFGNGLSRTLGFGPSDQDTGDTTQVNREEGDNDNKETASNSWFDLGISNILAFKKDSSEIDRNVLDTKSEDIARGHADSDNTASNSQDSEFDATSQSNQNLNPLESQKVVTDLVEDAKEGEKKFDPFASKNDVTSRAFFMYMKPMSIGQSVCKIEDSPKHHLDSHDETEFTNELQNMDNSNISLVSGLSDEEHEALRRDEEILRLEDSVEQSKVQESRSDNEKQEQVHDEVKGEDVDQQKYLDNTQNNIEEISQKRLQAKTQDEFNETEKHENWKVSDINNHEENNSLEFDAHYLKRRDDKFTDENLSETDIEKHSPHWNTPTQNGKEIVSQDLPGTFTSVINFLKEGSFGPSLTLKTEEKESKDEKHDVLGKEEKQKEIKLTEEQESSQVLVEKRKEAVKETENVQNYFTPTENEEPVEKLQVKMSEDLMDREQLDLKKQKDLMEAEKANEEALKDLNRQVNMKKEAVKDEFIEEIEEKNIVKLGSSVEKGNVDDFKDDEEERFEKGEGEKHEVVNPFIEGEVVEESKEENIAESSGENGDLVKELGEGGKREEGGEKFEKENELDGESEEGLKEKWQEKFNNREQEEVKHTERYEVNSELVEKLEEKYKVLGESVEMFEIRRDEVEDEEQGELEKLEKYEVHGELVEQTENDTVQIQVKKYEEEGELEEKRYELSRELTEKREEELEDMGQNVGEQKSTLDGEVGDNVQEKSKMDMEFNKNVLEEVETLKQYEAGAEAVEKLELEDTQGKKQEEVKLLEKYEVIGQSVKMFEDNSQEDVEQEGDLEEKMYELSRELTEKREEELEDMGQNVGEQKSTLDGEVGDKVQDKSKMDTNFNRNVLEEVETLKQYEAGAEPVEELEIEDTQGKKQEEVKLLEKYEVIGQSVKMFEDNSQEDVEQEGELEEKMYELSRELTEKREEELEDMGQNVGEQKSTLDGEVGDKVQDKSKMDTNFNKNVLEEVETLKQYEAGAEPVEELEIEDTQGKKQEEVKLLEKYEVIGQSVKMFEDNSQEDVEQEGELEEKMYELSRELTEKREEELEDMGQNVGEQKSTLDGEVGDKVQDKSKMDTEFNKNVLEELETLKQYEAGAEPVEELEIEDTQGKKQEEVKLLEKYEVIGQSVKMFEDNSQEDVEHKEQEKSNQLDHERNEVLKLRILPVEVEENTIEEAKNWKDAEELEEDGTHDEFVQANKEGKQEFGGNLKVNVDTQKIGDFVDWRNVREETKSFECMDELCTQMDQNEIQRGREGNSFEAGSNLISDTLTPSDILLGDATQDNPKKTPEIAVNGNSVNSGSENEFSVQIGESNESTAESGGFFGLFKKAMNTFYQSPNMETKELPESPSEIDENFNEILKLPPVYPTEKEMDYRNKNTEFEAILQPPTTPNSDSGSLPTNTAKPPQPNLLPKIDKTLQDHTGKEDTTILEELDRPNANLKDQETTVVTPTVMEEKQKGGDPDNERGSMAEIQGPINGIQEQSSSQTHTMEDFLKWLMQVVSSLPDDMRPGPDLYGIPWEPIIISSLIGLLTALLFTCRFYRSVKSRIYRRKEWWLAEQVAQLLVEKCEVLETLGKCQQEYDELEDSLKNGYALAETNKTKDLEVKAQQLDLAKTLLEDTLLELKDQLDQQKAHRIEQEQKITLLEENMGKLEEETKELQSQEEQAQTTIKVYNMNCERLQKNMETSSEENTLFKESNTQLRQQVEGWAERVCELEEEIRRYELAHSGMMQDVANKDERIMSLTDRLLGMKAWDADLDGGRSDTFKGTTGKEKNRKVHQAKSEVHLQKVQKLIYAAKLNADLKSVDEDKDRVFAKLNDEVKAKEDLEESIKELEKEQSSMQAETEHYSEQVQRLQQKLQIMTEMYQENELKLHRLLTVEEKDRLQKEDKLNKADKNIALAMEELNNYKHRAGEMEEELEKTKQSYQTQISSHEKKAHNNWLAARAADRQLSDIKRENSLLRQKITDTQFKLDALDKDPFALDSLARPLPYRAERLPYGPSPLGRPASENRALLSSPTLLEGHLNRLSPRVTRGPIEHTGVQGEMERSGGPHSDSGSISPSWEKDRRGPPPPPPPGPGPGPFPPQGYMFPEQGGPIYRRPGPPPGVMGPFPHPGPPFPHPRSLPMPGPLGPVQSTDTTDGINRENSLGPEHNHREPGLGDGRIPPESVLRMGAPPPPGPPMGPLDGPFPRRAPFEPPDFFPPRGPGGPPMMPMWGPRPGMMLPPRYPHSGPPPPHPLSYGPPMRPPLTDGLPPLSTSQQFVPHSQSLDEQKTLP
ncbi:cTAGE family member 5 isoform X2 [Stigmatopora argus]